MSHRTPVKGAPLATLWLLVMIAVVLVVGLGIGAQFLLPQVKERQALEKHYQAGVAFQNAHEWEAARNEYMQVISLDAGYEDGQARLSEVKAKLEESAAATTAVAVARAAQVQAQAQATATVQAQAQAQAQVTATAQARATATAQANAQATVAAAPMATAEALERHYQKGLGYVNLGQWENARVELEQVFEVDPNYKDVQANLEKVNAEVARLIPTSTPVPTATPTPRHTPTPTVVRSSSFDGTSTEGWTLNKGTLVNPGTGGNGGGANNGCLTVTPPGDSLTSYYVAPSKYYGNWLNYSQLKLDVWSSGGKYNTSGYKSYGDIFLASGQMTAQRLLPERPPEHWKTFAVPLRDSGEWVLGGGANTLNDVLANVTDLQIRAEYGDGADKSGLDNVVLVR